MFDSFVSMDILAFLIVTIIEIVIIAGWKESDKPSRVFAVGMAFVLVGLFCEILSYLVPPVKENIQLILHISLFGVLCGCVTSPSFAYYSVYLANKYEKVMSIWFARSVLIINTAAIAIGIYGFAVNKLFIVDPDALRSGIIMEIIYLLELVSTLIIVIGIISHAKRMKPSTVLALIAIVIIPFCAAIVEALSDGIYISYASFSISCLVQFVLIQSRLIAEARVREKLENEISRTDELTALLNRRAYSEYMDAMDDTVDAGAVFFDVNNLKKTNDELGHAAGDKLLIRFADLLKDNLKNAAIFRISGDEFVAVYPGADNKEVFDREIDNIRAEIKRQNDIASTGAFYAEHMNIYRIVAEAERLMYEDKTAFYKRTGIDRRKR